MLFIGLQMDERVGADEQRRRLVGRCEGMQRFLRHITQLAVVDDDLRQIGVPDGDAVEAPLLPLAPRLGDGAPQVTQVEGATEYLFEAIPGPHVLGLRQLRQLVHHREGEAGVLGLSDRMEGGLNPILRPGLVGHRIRLSRRCRIGRRRFLIGSAIGAVALSRGHDIVLLRLRLPLAIPLP